MYNIALQDKETGETKIIKYESQFKDGDDEDNDMVVDFMWTEGNYSCDCNRHVFFYDSDAGENPCGDKRFNLVKIEKV